MGYIANGRYVRVVSLTDIRLTREIHEEVDNLYKRKYGKRNPNSLSTQEIEQVNHEAMVRVQNRRKGRLIE